MSAFVPIMSFISKCFAFDVHISLVSFILKQFLNLGFVSWHRCFLNDVGQLVCRLFLNCFLLLRFTCILLVGITEWCVLCFLIIRLTLYTFSRNHTVLMCPLQSVISGGTWSLFAPLWWHYLWSLNNFKILSISRCLLVKLIELVIMMPKLSQIWA